MECLQGFNIMSILTKTKAAPKVNLIKIIPLIFQSHIETKLWHLYFTLEAIRLLTFFYILIADQMKVNCKLPESWKGRWFQSGIQNPIVIDRMFIEGKGTCYEMEEDKYLFVEK